MSGTAVIARPGVARALEGYRRFLARRDGAPDPHRRTLRAREQFFERFEQTPIRSRHVFDREVFLRNLRASSIEPGLDERMVWLLATARANQSERFGVELGRLYGMMDHDAEDEVEELHIVLQEDYHTRILADVVDMFDLPVPASPPPLGVGAMIHVMVFAPIPERMMLPLVGMSEMLGCVIFRALRDRGLELFADEPAVAGRIRVLFDEILADELCHVGFARARLGSFGRRVMDAMYRRFAPRVAQTFPELFDLIGRERLLGELAKPFDLDGRVAEFPDTAYAFAV